MTSKSSAKANLLGSGGIYLASGETNGDLTNGHVNHAFCEIPLDSGNGTLKKSESQNEKICMLEIPSSNGSAPEKDRSSPSIVPENTHRKFFWGEKLYLNKSETDLRTHSKMTRRCQRGTMLGALALLVALALAIGIFATVGSRSSSPTTVKVGSFRDAEAMPINHNSLDTATEDPDDGAPLTTTDMPDAVLVSLTLPDEQFTVALQNDTSPQFAALNKTLIEALSSALVGLENTLVRARIVSFESGSIKAKIVFEFDEGQSDLAERVNQLVQEYLRTNRNQVGEMAAMFDASQTQDMLNKCRSSDPCAPPAECLWDYLVDEPNCVCPVNYVRAVYDSRSCVELPSDKAAEFFEESGDISSESSPGGARESEPKAEPTPEPSAEPTAEPAAEPSPEPSAEPAAEPSAEPPAEPTPEPSAEPPSEPSAEPTPESSAEPSAEPEPEPSAEPAPEPSAEATPEPTAESSPELSAESTPEPSAESTPEPSAESEPEPSAESEPEPSAESEPEPSDEPTPEPSAEPPVELSAEAEQKPSTEASSEQGTEPTSGPSAESSPEASSESTSAPSSEELILNPSTAPAAKPSPKSLQENAGNSTLEPAPEPSAEPTLDPSAEPASSAEPAPEPEPSAESSPEPSAEATPEPEPSSESTPEPEPSAESTPEPSAESTPEPSAESTPEPAPAAESTPEQSAESNSGSTAEPTSAPSSQVAPGSESHERTDTESSESELPGLTTPSSEERPDRPESNSDSQETDSGSEVITSRSPSREPTTATESPEGSVSTSTPRGDFESGASTTSEETSTAAPSDNRNPKSLKEGSLWEKSAESTVKSLEATSPTSAATSSGETPSSERADVSAFSTESAAVEASTSAPNRMAKIVEPGTVNNDAQSGSSTESNKSVENATGNAKDSSAAPLVTMDLKSSTENITATPLEENLPSAEKLVENTSAVSEAAQRKGLALDEEVATLSLNETTTVPSNPCKENEFQCDSRCVDSSLRCDGFSDCIDQTDEANCTEISCGRNFLCANTTTCIPQEARCDGVKDCPDADDEDECLGSLDKCEEGLILCPDKSYCLKPSQVCDGVFNCRDRLDESKCQERNDCENVQKNFFCPTEDLCIDGSLRCDGLKDCQDGSDEKNCTCLPEQFQCDNAFCVSKPNARCDGILDCKDGSDEVDCLRTDDKMTVQVFDPIQNQFTLLCGDELNTSDVDSICREMGFEKADSYELVKLQLNGSQYATWESTKAGSLFSAGIRGNATQCSNTAIRVKCQELTCTHSDQIDFLRRRRDAEGDTEESPWSYLVLVQGPEKTDACHGQVLTPRHVVTSAQCLKNLKFKTADELSILTTLSDPSRKTVFKARNVHFHPHFSQFRSKILADYDLAVVRSESPLTVENKKIRPVCVYDDPLANGITCFVGSYGDGVPRSHNYTTVVSKMPLIINDSAQCNQEFIYDKKVSQQMICASADVNSAANRQPCDTDLGAPLMCLSGRAQWKLAGLLSYQRFCGRFFKQPTTFSSIHSMLPWINKVTGRSSYNVSAAELNYSLVIETQNSTETPASTTPSELTTLTSTEDPLENSTAIPAQDMAENGREDPSAQMTTLPSITETSSPANESDASNLTTSTPAPPQLYAAQTQPPVIQVIQDGDSERRVALSRFSTESAQGVYPPLVVKPSTEASPAVTSVPKPAEDAGTSESPSNSTTSSLPMTPATVTTISPATAEMVSTTEATPILSTEMSAQTTSAPQDQITTAAAAGLLSSLPGVSTTETERESTVDSLDPTGSTSTPMMAVGSSTPASE
ncbi:uncharacterized protein LOC108864284 [Galendromus occidentalis]|uniref:Uncharacterized protein LOC108864284 n=1 Tax=Galendromus occidentalis TaxID=34638 RepID=A0AAJ7WIM7_9ACAR|nr:uncharacterized protein LOC108864284 [Galendromus occidentalis]